MSSQAAESFSLHDDLRRRWEDIWKRFRLSPRTGQFETLMSRWGESHRHYHTPVHLLESLEALDGLKGYTNDGRPAEFALFYHDCFHNVHKQNNEQKSAEMAKATFVKSGGDELTGQLIHDLVLSTTHTCPVYSIDAALVTDSDLWILGAPPDRFDEYERQVRLEYRHVQDVHYIKARSRVLHTFFDRSFVYRTPVMRTLLEASARENLKRSLAALAINPT